MNKMSTLFRSFRKTKKLFGNASLKLFLSFSFLCSSSLASLGAYITFDFRKLYTEQSPEDISASALLSYFDTEDNTSDLVSGIPYCNLAYGFSNGLKAKGAYSKATASMSDFGALFINATDPETKEDNGGITIQIAPQNRHRNTNLNIFVYKDENNIGSGDNVFTPQLEVAFNGGEYQKTEITKSDDYSCTFNIKPNGTIIKDLSIRIPNPARNKNGELPSDSYISYYLALTHINLYYTDETPQQVTEWQFSEFSHTGYINGSTPYEMPVLTTIPAEAADMMELSSSDPKVAMIENGKIILKGEGKTTITAVLADNPLFVPGASYQPASYELTVEKSTSTAIELTTADKKENQILYDLHGCIVTGSPAPGVYILKSASSIKKILVN